MHCKCKRSDPELHHVALGRTPVESPVPSAYTCTWACPICCLGANKRSNPESYRDEPWNAEDMAALEDAKAEAEATIATYTMDMQPSRP